MIRRRGSNAATTAKPASARRRHAWYASPTFKRLLACLGGGVTLALMTFPEDGTTADYYFVIKNALFAPRILVFLGIGVLLFLFITFRPTVVPYFTRPGFWPLVSGSVAVLAAMVLLHWADQVGDGKFSTVAAAVADTSGISPVASAYFAFLACASRACRTASRTPSPCSV